MMPRRRTKSTLRRQIGQHREVRQVNTKEADKIDAEEADKIHSEEVDIINAEEVDELTPKRRIGQCQEGGQN